LVPLTLNAQKHSPSLRRVRNPLINFAAVSFAHSAAVHRLLVGDVHALWNPTFPAADLDCICSSTLELHHLHNNGRVIVKLLDIICTCFVSLKEE